MSGDHYEGGGWAVRKTGNVYSRDDLRPTYDRLVEEAEEEYGRYSGDINRSSGFQMCGVMTRNQYGTAHSWLDDIRYRSKKRATPKFLSDQGVVDNWKYVYDEKDGPACAVIIKDETRDATLISGAFIKDKGVIPANNREKKKYVVNYKGSYGPDFSRFSSIPDAWKWIKNQIKKNPEFKVDNIENSYTYARPKIGQRTKKGKKVYVEFFGFADD